MEIDITEFFDNAEPFDFSASRAERGDTAGPDTWRNAKREAEAAPLLTAPEQLCALRHHMRQFGAWDEEEIVAWDDDECNALFIQLISGDMREIEALCTKDDGEVDWVEYRRLQEEGTVFARLYRGDDGRIYFPFDD